MPSLLDEMLVAWAYTREGVIAEVRNLPESALGFKPNPAARTSREITQHIVESGLLMSGEMHHGVSHEEYHRGQLALYARLLGHVPALTKLIQGG